MKSANLISLVVCLAATAHASGYLFTRLVPPGSLPVNMFQSGGFINNNGVASFQAGADLVTYDGSTYNEYSSFGGQAPEDIGGMDNNGNIAFDYSTANGVTSASVNTFGQFSGPYSYPGAPYTFAPAISSNGLVAGWYDDPSFNQFGYVRNGNTFTQVSYPGPHGQIYLFGVNDNGDVVGLSACCRSGPSFLKQGSTYTTVSAGTFAEAMGVNDFDTVVGWDDPGDSTEQGFIWSNGTSTSLSYPGATDTILRSINDSGVILGYAQDASGQFAFLATPASAPEPTSLLLIGAGLLGLAKLRRR